MHTGTLDQQAFGGVFISCVTCVTGRIIVVAEWCRTQPGTRRGTREQRARRNNLRFFNLSETGKNSHTACAEQVLEREVCSRRCLHWSDKMAILNTGRQTL
ncbi:hypothetical protein BaRGS_00039681 [Batillaria attramentaria]|uniref:Uncharacterized protein n=1 Tax=Batillaria attramentaria TaxID=370345 RepID=A0ABD0J2K6_9CAEN